MILIRHWLVSLHLKAVALQPVGSEADLLSYLGRGVVSNEKSVHVSNKDGAWLLLFACCKSKVCPPGPSQMTFHDSNALSKALVTW